MLLNLFAFQSVSVKSIQLKSFSSLDGRDRSKLLESLSIFTQDDFVFICKQI